MTGLMIWSERLNESDPLAISEEFREWLNEGVKFGDVLKSMTIKNNHKLEREIYAAILSISNSLAISLSTTSPSSLRFTNLSKSTIL